MGEQRSSLRKNTSLKGEIHASGGRMVACIVSNLSAHGAKLNVVRSAELPGTFQLKAADLDLDVHAKLVWRTDDEVGVRFPLTA